ncbi:hypothetical protein ACFFX0_31580 [Citricoccus parietis]|uniref:Uncharacterized protein n=1 Tax=Citricoccus parietis TaxID=592307 RepID=A0ABV5G925_9MICC
MARAPVPGRDGAPDLVDVLAAAGPGGLAADAAGDGSAHGRFLSKRALLPGGRHGVGRGGSVTQMKTVGPAAGAMKGGVPPRSGV